uniref:Protein phosphatase 1K, mitochondrial n=1 Tax=Solanum tuberosum TaxID=4113 RepID=M1C0H3_SOLTU
MAKKNAGKAQRQCAGMKMGGRTRADFDQEMVAFEYHLYAGSTAVVALIYNNHVLVANVDAASLGDLFAKELTSDHNAHRLDEKARVEASGGVFKSILDFVPLLMGHFPMTRAIGDVPLKKYDFLKAVNLFNALQFLFHDYISVYGIIADPEVTDWLSLTSKDEFLVVASDGIFESVTPQAVCDFLNEVEDYSNPSLLAHQLIQKAYLEGSNDNLSVVLVPWGFTQCASAHPKGREAVAEAVSVAVIVPKKTLILLNSRDLVMGSLNLCYLSGQGWIRTLLSTFSNFESAMLH